MKSFSQLLLREVKLFWNNKSIRKICIAGPIVYALLFGAVYQKGKVTDLPILVIDKDNSPSSSKIVDMLDDSETLKPTWFTSQNGNYETLIAQNEYAAVVMIPDNFEAQVLQTKYPEIVVDVNTANVVTANYSSKAIQQVLGTFSAGVEMEGLKKKGLPAAIALERYEPFKVNYIRLYNRAANYMSFLWPGMLATIMQQILLLALALSFAQEYENKSFDNLVHQGHGTFKLIMVKVMPYWLYSFLAWLFFGFMYRLFQVDLASNTLAMFTLGAVFVLAVSMLGVAVSIAVPSQLKATELLMIVATPSFVLSGYTWPLSQMPVWIQYVSKTIPLTHFLEAFRKLQMYGANLSDILPQLKMLSLQALVFGLLAFVLLKLKFKAVHSKS
ncbi:MAG: ABC transporter permease [Sphingobacteriaceae bacterium]|nr:ABC transporter permease [Sphingobacteriaceae bacterium]